MRSWQTRGGLTVLQLLSGRSNVFLLTNNQLNVLIDTSPARKWEKLQTRLKENKIESIQYLILTHSHFDHAGNAKVIREKFGCKVIIHQSEDYYLKTGEICPPKGTNNFTKFIVKNLAVKFSTRLKCEPCQSDILIDKVMDLNSFGLNAALLHTPGHTPGSVSIIVDDEIALVGDAMFGVFRESVFPPYADNVAQLIDSWGLLLETKCEIFLPSHGRAKSRFQLLKDYQRRKI
jgi:hydroxyacylglutathione hydrolase